MAFLKNRNNQPPVNKNERETVLRAFAFQEMEALMAGLSTSPDGLAARQAEERQDAYGKNIIAAGSQNTTLHLLRESAVNPFNVVLFVIAVITLFTDVIFSSKPDFLTVGIIVTLILLSILVAFVQGERSNAAAEKLSGMLSHTTDP